MSKTEPARPVRVLLADDTADMRTLLRVTLQNDGRFEVVGEATNGEEAIALTKETAPDAIVLDLAMPVMDGLQALPEIRRSVPTARIIVLSGFNACEVANEALSLGADGYLEKGAALSRLVAVILETPPPSVNGSAGGPLPISDAAAVRIVEDKPSPMDPDLLSKEVVDAVSTGATFVSAFSRFTSLVGGLVPFDRASFWVTTGHADTFECVAAHDANAERLPVGAHLTAAGRVRRVLSGHTVVEPDTSTDEEGSTNDTLNRTGIRSYVCIPLVIAGETKALINFASERPQAFSLQYAPLLERLVGETASTLHLLYLLDKEREIGSRLREADDHRSDLVGMVAHDLRSPMTVIGGYAKHMRDSWADLAEDQKLEFLESISRNVDQVAHLVEDMLEVASFESGQISCDVKPFDLGEMVRSTVAELAVANLGRTCRMSLPEDLPHALGDIRRQRQILANLVGNALKFSVPPQPVDVDVAVDDGVALVTVRDEGPGIEPEHLAKIFEKFYRVAGGGQPKAPGNGLGLYICKLLVEAQGGRIWAESTPGEGSTFTYTVRVVEARVVQQSGSAA